MKKAIADGYTYIILSGYKFTKFIRFFVKVYRKLALQ